MAVELARVRVRRLADAYDARNAWLGAARVVEEGEIADLHLVAHEVPRLVIAHAEPSDRLLRHRREVVDRNLVGLRLHQPVAHKKKRGVASTTPRQNRPPACAVPTVILNLGSRGSPTRTIRRFRVGSAHRSIRARRPRYRSIGSKSVWPARTPQGTNVAVEQAVDNFRKAFPAPPSHDRWLSAWRKFYAEWPRCQNRRSPASRFWRAALRARY